MTEEVQVYNDDGEAAVVVPASKMPYTIRDQRFKGKVERFHDNPDIGAIEPSLAIHDVRINELLNRLERGDTEQFRIRLERVYREYLAALEGGDEELSASKLNSFGKQLSEGIDRDKCWKGLLDLVRKRAKMAKDLGLLSAQSRTLVSAHDMRRYHEEVTEILIKYVPPERIKEAISELRTRLS